HILLSDSLEADEVRVLDHLFSDHLPIAVDIRLPPACLDACLATNRGETRRQR
ncbi:EEP domain-containing protein, partial [Halomonas sp. KAO]|nr:EEP domain-containing protein [Halomonas sp. KAO]